MLARAACPQAGAILLRFPQAAQDFAQLSQTKLPMPVLAIGGENRMEFLLGNRCNLLQRTRPSSSRKTLSLAHGRANERSDRRLADLSVTSGIYA
jgi:hypothetical protein